MRYTYSPLRYPGGKSNLHQFTANLMQANDLDGACYIEPFAGGCGLALGLLIESYASEVYLNDIDYAIWAFWDSVLNESEALVEKIANCKVDMENWHKQKYVQANCGEFTKLDVAFSTFFLNRTNRSGIIKNAGPIGGLNQNGNYKIDCRFNKSELIGRIQRIAKYKSRIHLFNMDAIDFLNFAESKIEATQFFCIDPPYFAKGKGLYTSFYEKCDHEKLAERIQKIKAKWITTYDNVPEIRALYQNNKQANLYLNYSLQQKRIGTEILIYSDNVNLSEFEAKTAA